MGNTNERTPLTKTEMIVIGAGILGIVAMFAASVVLGDHGTWAQWSDQLGENIRQQVSPR